MEKDVGLTTHSDTSDNVDNKDCMQITVSDLNTNCLNKQWEMNPINDMTMSDITRAVNAFITDPGSSMHDRVFPKKEPVEDLCEGLFCQSETNNETVDINTPGSGNAQKNSLTNDRTEGYVILRQKVALPKGVNSTNILKCKSFVTGEMIVCKDRALGISTTASNTSVSSDSQKNVQEDGTGKELSSGNFLPTSVEGLNLYKFSKMPTNSGIASGELKSRRSDVGSTSTRPVKKLTSTFAAGQLVTRKYYFCPIKECNKKFPSKREIDNHVNKHHKVEGFHCLKCGKRFGRISNLEQHDNVHTGIKPYGCDECGNKFHTQMNMYQHRKSKHVEPENKLQCEICGVVGNRSFMSKHTRRVHLKQRYHCTECLEDFRLVRYLKDHMRMHRGEEPYTCDLCAKTFVQKNNLLQHLKRHARELKCPKCDKVFKSKDYLKGHLLQHEGIKKFCCNICGKTFHHAHYLFTHKKSHGERGFDCAICGGKFSRKDNLKSHIIRHQTTGRTNLKKKKV